MTNNKKGNKKGFTLIELIVVLAILAIIAAIAIPSAFTSIDNARMQADDATIASVNSAIRTHAGLTLEKGKVASGLTVETCLTNTGVSAPITIQSENTKVRFISGTNDTPGHYTSDPNVTAGDNAITETDSTRVLKVDFKVTGSNTTPPVGS